MNKEIWKDIEGYEDMYMISNMGKVKNVVSESILKGHIKDGRRYVYLSDNKSTRQGSKYFPVHKLVATYFLDNSENKKIIEHIDGDNLNNEYINLRWSNYPYISRRKNRKREHKIIKKKNIDNVSEMGVEEWRDIEGYENHYKVSNYGKIKNVKKNRLLKPVIVSNYYTVQLYLNKTRTRYKIHQLVANNFIPNPKNKEIIDHIDNNKINNKVNNLRWFTQSENISSYNNNFKKKMIKPILQYNLNMELIKEWTNIIDIIDEYNYTQSMLRSCLNGKTKTAYGYIWKYKNEVKKEIILEEGEEFKNIGVIDDRDYSNYDVSNYGRVKSKKHNIILKYNKSGPYYTIMLYDKNISKGYRLSVHRLVAHVFVKGETKIKNIVNHKDENKHNNKASNLEWMTRAENNKYSFAKKVKQIDPQSGEVIRIHDSLVDACESLGLDSSSSSHISACCNKPKRKTAYGYKWEFVK